MGQTFTEIEIIVHPFTERQRQKDRERERQTDRQTDADTDRERACVCARAYTLSFWW